MISSLLVLLVQALVLVAAQLPRDIVYTDQSPNVTYSNPNRTTQDSAFQQNLNFVINFLASASPPNGYATCLGYGARPNTVYAHTACYNMSNQTTCSQCIAQAFARFEEPPPVGGRLWINESSHGDGCNLWFETTILALPQDTYGIIGPNDSSRPPDITYPDQSPDVTYLNPARTTEGSPYQQNLDFVMGFLASANPRDGYATCVGYGDSPNTAYAHTACYNMSDQTTCSQCIRQSYASLRETLSTGGRLWTTRTPNGNGCNIWFETTPLALPLDTYGIVGPNSSAIGGASQGSGGSDNRTAIVVGASVGSVLAALLIVGIVWLLFARNKNIHRADELQELAGKTKGPVVYSYQSLRVATEDFDEQHKLGQGGFGPVYKAVLGGIPVAIKKLSVGSQQGKREFVNEIDIITGIQHRNLVRLEGYCADGDHRLLVYEFLENSSVDKALFGGNDSLFLDWTVRFQIIVGVARGLAYLHDESHSRIIHRDIKASNILLDRTLAPKISDFGISKLAGVNRDADMITSTYTRVAGTLGYMAPEYALEGRLSPKADVYSFGILVLEIISGRRCRDPTLPPDEDVLLTRARMLYYNGGRVGELVDARLGKNYDERELEVATHIGLLCSQDAEETRPVMSAVVAMLMGYLELTPLSSLSSLGQTWPTSFSGQITVLSAR